MSRLPHGDAEEGAGGAPFLREPYSLYDLVGPQGSSADKGRHASSRSREHAVDKLFTVFPGSRGALTHGTEGDDSINSVRDKLLHSLAVSSRSTVFMASQRSAPSWQASA